MDLEALDPGAKYVMRPYLKNINKKFKYVFMLKE